MATDDRKHAENQVVKAKVKAAAGALTADLQMEHEAEDEIEQAEEHLAEVEQADAGDDGDASERA
jgi:hypothetical protein